ncbi:MAG: YfiM family protein [candidate division KSB1 bacterium]|nr:YfiM family protein [candidate division KSB1 bacterium]
MPIPNTPGIAETATKFIKLTPIVRTHYGFGYRETGLTNWYSSQILRLNSTRASPKVNKSRLILSSTGVLLGNYLVYSHCNEAWWQEERTRFHLYRGWRRSRGWWDFGWHDSLYFHMDKWGHFYCARLLSELMRDLSTWVGFNKQSASIIGPLISSLLMLEIEVYDGFFKEWGFSLGDFTANEVGAIFPVLQDRFDFLKKLNLKLSYHRSGEPTADKYFIKDYAGMTFWLCYDIKDDLPNPLGQFWPRFLNLGLGYSVTKQVRGELELYLAPDVNWYQILPHNNKFLTAVEKWLNFIHFPCLTWQLTPREKLHTIYF